MSTNINAGLSPILPAWTAGDRLDSWKEIATYLRREARTVQLWEKKGGLPVHRHFHQQLGSVYAFRSEVDRWRREVSRHRSSLNEPESTTASGERIVIRVLPLKNLRGDAAWNELCKMVAAKTAVELERLNPERVAVVVQESASSEEPASTTVSESEAGYALRWTAEQDGAALKISAELVCVPTKKAEWSQVYKADRKDWDAAPQQIAQQISQCLWLKMVYRP